MAGAETGGVEIAAREQDRRVLSQAGRERIELSAGADDNIPTILAVEVACGRERAIRNRQLSHRI